jgi:hypothetical protein
MAWRAARSLLVLQQQLQAGAPRARPPATGADEWGLIGDAAHDPTSDHAPKNFPGWGSQIVTAADFPNRPDLGLDAHKALDDIRRSHDSRVKYGISNDQIFSSYATNSRRAWEWGPYNPGDKKRDRHMTHGHLSVVGDARADGEQPWHTIGAPAAAAADEEDDMGQSFGPTLLLEDGRTPFTIPPVQGGAADPREVWLNVGADSDGAPVGVRVMASRGDGKGWFPQGGAEVHVIPGNEVLSISLDKGVRQLSIARAEPLYAGPISVCFERK